MKAHLLFEQSGTFKREFKNLGWEAYDYDILNGFDETDYQIDLFNEIEKAYNNKSSIFDNFKSEDYVLAFFPCIRFEHQFLLTLRGNNKSQKKWSEQKKLEYNIKLMKEVFYFYEIISKLVLVCVNKNLKLIIENPYNVQHFLTRYWTIKPKVIDTNRRDMGDYFVKPSQYFFINCEPSNNLIFEDLKNREILLNVNEAKDGKIGRSLISPKYAENFIKKYILTYDEYLKTI